MNPLAMKFCGLETDNPFFLSSSCVAGNYEMCARALDMGWGGIVTKTFGFYVPNELSPRFDAVYKEGTPFVGFKNLEQISDKPLDENLKWVERLKRDYPHKGVIVSIMGETEEEWTKIAQMAQQAGADILECNFSCPHMAENGMGCDVGQDTSLVERFCQAVRKGTTLPFLAKMTPNIGNMEPSAIAAIKGGADGIAAINTIKSITGLKLDNLSSYPDIRGKSSTGGYSGKAIKPIALRFIKDMASHPELKGIPLSGMGGIETWEDALEFILLGATNLQVTTAVMQYGYRIIKDIVEGALFYLEDYGYKSLNDLVGLGLPNLVSPDTLDRGVVYPPSINEKACIGCGRCYLSCADGGHQAVCWASGPRRPSILLDKCVGCHLCALVCPTGAIG